MSQSLHGVLPAVVTPLTDQEQLAAGAFESLLERMYSAGAHGVYVCGNTGEGLLLPLQLREEAAEIAVRCTPRGKSAVIHVGCLSNSDAVRLAKHAARIGAQAISSLPPHGAYSAAEIRAYYEQLSAAAGIPVLVYYFPQVAPQVTAEQAAELCTIPGVAGLKFTDFDLYTLSRIQAAGNTVFNGRDEVFIAGMLMGADGGIGSFYNLVPELFVGMYDAARRRDWVEARRLQDQVNELIALVLPYPLIPAIKTILSWRGIPCGEAVAPRRALSHAERAKLLSDMEDFLSRCDAGCFLSHAG